jgi:phosphoenolpyruvate synthase/pyruvate phosphate dikinase
MRIVHDLSELGRADLSTAGGKGANLGEMRCLGLPVPPGFVVSTRAYAEQARRWGLAERLSAHLAANEDKAAASEAAELFRSGVLLPDIESAIREAHRRLGAGRVAVRSSATAEDLVDASFAGQQETYLDVAGEDEVIASIRSCWASLFSPRALHYRRAKGISHLSVEIAVVVQQMVPAEAAGVLFTVDPVQQRSDWMLLSAAPGLGEAIVAGHRRGDTYRIRREPHGGIGRPAGSPAPQSALAIVDRDLESPGRSVLSDAELLELARLGLSLEAHFGCPQDVEFAVAAGRVFLLQSRPITTLGAAEIEPI